jgi:hypothetical protein
MGRFPGYVALHDVMEEINAVVGLQGRRPKE